MRKRTNCFLNTTRKELNHLDLRRSKNTNNSPKSHAGYKFLSGSRVKIGNRVYQFWKSREIEGTVKTLTIKRTSLGELFMVIVVDDAAVQEIKFATGRIAGFDFGLKTFLTPSDGSTIESPQFLRQSLNAVKKASQHHSKKLKGSANRERARKNLVRQHENISNSRRDWFWKLAHDLTNRFDALCFETLNLKRDVCGGSFPRKARLGMQRLWGRKISDLAFGARKQNRRSPPVCNCCERFLQILEWVAKKKGKQVVFVDKWYPSSKTCHSCNHVLESLDLSIREWRCPSCQIVNGRDENAAKNIHMVGASTIGLGDVRQSLTAIAV